MFRALLVVILAVFCVGCESETILLPETVDDTLTLPPFSLQEHEIRVGDIMGQEVLIYTPTGVDPDVKWEVRGGAVTIYSVTRTGEKDWICECDRNIWRITVMYKGLHLGTSTIQISLKSNPRATSSFRVTVVPNNQ